MVESHHSLSSVILPFLIYSIHGRIKDPLAVHMDTTLSLVNMCNPDESLAVMWHHIVYVSETNLIMVLHVIPAQCAIQLPFSDGIRVLARVCASVGDSILILTGTHTDPIEPTSTLIVV
jgi:hypothetical protein